MRARRPIAVDCGDHARPDSYRPFAGLVLATALLYGPSVFGQWRERGEVFSTAVMQEKIEEANPAEAQRFVSQVCGRDVHFDRADESTQYSIWPDKDLVTHEKLEQPFSNVVSVTIGSPAYTCSARFSVTLKWNRCKYSDADEGAADATSKGRACYSGDLNLVSMQLLARIEERPHLPKGVQPLMLGERVIGRLAAGETARFRVSAPDVGQHVIVEGRRVGLAEPAPSNELADRVTIVVKRDGRVVELNNHGSGNRLELLPDAVVQKGGGTFDIAMQGPRRGSGYFCLLVSWNQRVGVSSCVDVDMRTRSGVALPVAGRRMDLEAR